MGAETGLRIRRTDFNYVRSICWQKPFVTLMKGTFSSFGKDGFALLGLAWRGILYSTGSRADAMTRGSCLGGLSE